MSFPEFVAGRWESLLRLAGEHLILVFVPVLVGTAVGIGLGVATFRTRRPRELVLNVASTFMTIPSFALIGLMIPLFGIGRRPAMVALVTYTLLPVVRNTITGLREVDPAVVESARGMGLGSWQRLARIQLPLAWPVILAGVRVATLLLMGIAALAAIPNGGGLGEPIFQGLARMGTPAATNLVLSGFLGITVLAVVVDAGFVLLGRLTTSRGLR